MKEGKVSYEGPASLAPRERECFRLMALGYDGEEIAERMGLSINTVKWYCARVTSKYGIRRVHVPIVAMKMGVIALREAVDELPEYTREVIAG